MASLATCHSDRNFHGAGCFHENALHRSSIEGENLWTDLLTHARRARISRRRCRTEPHWRTTTIPRPTNPALRRFRSCRSPDQLPAQNKESSSIRCSRFPLCFCVSTPECLNTCSQIQTMLHCVHCERKSAQASNT